MTRWFVLPVLLLLLTACSNRMDNLSGDIVFINETHIPVFSVSVSCKGETQGGLLADGSPLRKEDSLSFELVDAPSVVTAYGQDGEELASCTLTERPATQWKVFLTSREDGKLVLRAEN